MGGCNTVVCEGHIAEKVTADNWIEILGGVWDEIEKSAKTCRGHGRRVV
jgi:hypothetical protein